MVCLSHLYHYHFYGNSNNKGWARTANKYRSLADRNYDIASEILDTAIESVLCTYFFQ